MKERKFSGTENCNLYKRPKCKSIIQLRIEQVCAGSSLQGTTSWQVVALSLSSPCPQQYGSQLCIQNKCIPSTYWAIFILIKQGTTSWQTNKEPHRDRWWDSHYHPHILKQGLIHDIQSSKCIYPHQHIEFNFHFQERSQVYFGNMWGSGDSPDVQRRQQLPVWRDQVASDLCSPLVSSCSPEKTLLHFPPIINPAPVQGSWHSPARLPWSTLGTLSPVVVVVYCLKVLSTWL